jgi:hypothetical protein
MTVAYFWNTQRLRNLTTGRLHTEMKHIYEDLELLTGENGLMTHMLPRMLEAVDPWLRQHVTDPRFWDDKYDSSHVGEYALPEPTVDDRKAMMERYFAQPNPLSSKNIVVVTI